MRYLAFFVAFLSGFAQASPVFIDERNQFLNLFPDATLETFESINVPEYSNILISESLSSSTGGYIGDLQSGVRYTNPKGEIRILGHNDVSYFSELAPVASNRLSFTNDDGQELVLTFENHLSAFGLDIIGIEDPELNVSFITSAGESFSQDINLVLLESQFYGWDFQDNQISTIVIDAVDDYYFGIDNVLFATGGVTGIPEPASIYLLVLGLFGIYWLRNGKAGFSA